MIDLLKNIFNPFIKTIVYKGFQLYYTKGSTLMYELIKDKNSTYEIEVTEKILSELLKSKQPVFIDIGANLGLISLNVLSKIPNTRVYAFEPGPHQNLLFSKTISRNDLTSKISLYDEALSNTIGFSDFVIHPTIHSAGDGFIDTGRAGKGEKIKVKTTTLDKWWSDNKKPSVNVLKIDVEGSEFLILQGGAHLIKKEKPFILMEFYPPHFDKYPYSETDVLQWFSNMEYSVFDCYTDQLLTKDNLHLYKENLRDIYALPN